MIIIVVLIGAFVMNYVLVKIYGHLWEKDLDARVEFQKEPSVEGRDATLTETIYNRKWLFLPVLQVGFQMHRNLRFADGENTSVSDQCYKRDIFSVGTGDEKPVDERKILQNTGIAGSFLCLSADGGRDKDGDPVSESDGKCAVTEKSV